MGRKLIVRIELLINKNGLTVSAEDNALMQVIHEILLNEGKSNSLVGIINKFKNLNNKIEEEKIENNDQTQFIEIIEEKKIAIDSDDDDEDPLAFRREKNEGSLNIEDKQLDVVKFDDDFLAVDKNMSYAGEELQDDFDADNNNKEQENKLINTLNFVDDDFEISNEGSSKKSTHESRTNDTLVKQLTNELYDDFPTFEQNDERLFYGYESFHNLQEFHTSNKEDMEVSNSIKELAKKLTSSILSLCSSVKLKDSVINDYNEKIKFYLDKLSNMENKNKTFFLFKTVYPMNHNYRLYQS